MRSILTLAILALALSGCGGGSAGTSASASPATLPISATLTDATGAFAGNETDTQFDDDAGGGAGGTVTFHSTALGEDLTGADGDAVQTTFGPATIRFDAHAGTFGIDAAFGSATWSFVPHSHG